MKTQLRSEEHLVGVGEASHARHDAEDIVVDSKEPEVTGLCAVKVEVSVVDSGEVASTRRLVLFWVQSEGIDIGWIFIITAGVVLVWLDKAEVILITLGKAVVAIELDLGFTVTTSFHP